MPSSTFVSTPPPGAKGPDDITLLPTKGLDGGKALIWTAFQNGINPDGTPGAPGGPTQSTVAGYDPSTGTLVRVIQVTGKVDGLTADPKLDALIATVNEDANSAFNLIDPALGTVTTYTYAPNPAVAGNGGTDSISVRDNQIYVAHSNPNDLTQPAEYLVTLDEKTLTAKLTPVFYDDSPATDAVTGAKAGLTLTDPDTNFFMPQTSPRFAGNLATISQADGKIVFASHLKGIPHLKALTVTDNKAGNIPPLDGMAVSTSNHGILYVVDAGAGTILALDATGWHAGTVFVGEPSDNANPLVGTLDLSTGQVTPFGNHFQSPKGLLFVPAQSEDDR
ncbi:MAG: hypothetical protein OK455_07495 [Thaumarchaeota archaeon]|nr:hypothetical protein [Nitrososphaerota archaeon]